MEAVAGVVKVVISVTIPWLPKGYNPNGSQRNTIGKRDAARKYKLACAWLCKAQGIKPVGWEGAVVFITFHPPSRRAYDLDNALARCKHGLDAIAEAIGVDDAKWHSISLVRGEVRKGGEIIVELRPIEGVALVD